MFRPTRFAALAALSLAAMSQAWAVPAADAARPTLFQHMLQKFDSNGDGRISADEYLAAAATRFQAIDSQNKGSVDAADIAAAPAAAARVDRRAEAMVHRLDTAGNGYVTPDQFVVAAQDRFTRLDANHDGKLTFDEFAAGRHRHGAAAPAAGAAPKRTQFAQRRFDRLDANHDGAVTLAEYVAGAKALYAEFDSRHDGKVTADDIAASPRAQKRTLRVAEHLVRRMDANGDGSVSRDEFLAAAKARFARLDRNGDGYLDPSEAGGRHRARQTP